MGFFICTYCNKDFQNQRALDVHTGRKHKEELRINLTFVCKSCSKGFADEIGLIKHCSRVHKQRPSQYVLEYKLNNIIQLCKCGCNTPTNYNKAKGEFRDYCKGHVARVSNNYVTSGAIKKSAEIRQKLASLGLLKGKDSEETRRKKSESHLGDKNHTFGKQRPSHVKEKIGKKTSERCLDPLYKERFVNSIHSFWNSPASNEVREKMRVKACERMEREMKRVSKTEFLFADLLTSSGISFKHQFRVKSKVFDFRILDTNILVEVDGDFWHCNPLKYPLGPIYSKQITNVENDKFKNNLALQEGYVLIRVWQSEIQNNKTEVLNKIKQVLNTNDATKTDNIT